MKKEKEEKKEIPTAKQLFDSMLEDDEGTTSTEMMRKFAEIHVEEALLQASKKFKNADNIRFIKKAYPLTNIK